MYVDAESIKHRIYQVLYGDRSMKAGHDQACLIVSSHILLNLLLTQGWIILIQTIQSYKINPENLKSSSEGNSRHLVAQCYCDMLHICCVFLQNEVQVKKRRIVQNFQGRNLMCFMYPRSCYSQKIAFSRCRGACWRGMV